MMNLLCSGPQIRIPTACLQGLLYMAVLPRISSLILPLYESSGD